jgi:predicted ArsR family transcriptional regulator
MTLFDLMMSPYAVGPLCVLVGGIVRDISLRRRDFRRAALDREKMSVQLETSRETASAQLEQSYIDATTELLAEYRSALKQSRDESREDASRTQAEIGRLLAVVSALRMQVADLEQHIDDLYEVLTGNGLEPPLRRSTKGGAV